MDNAVIVRALETIGDLGGCRDRLLDRHRYAVNALGQRRPLNEFHHQGAEVAVALLKAEDLRDVRVIE